jgi:hypothetical protein
METGELSLEIQKKVRFSSTNFIRNKKEVS